MTVREKQANRVMGYLIRYAGEHDGEMPTFREIAAGAGIQLGQVGARLDILEEDGKIRRLKGRNRAIEVIQGVFVYDSNAGKFMPLGRLCLDEPRNRSA